MINNNESNQMIEKHPTHIFNLSLPHAPSFSHRHRKLFNIYMKMISHTLNSILDNCNKRFIPWFTSSSYQLQCMQDLKLIRVTSKYMKNVLIYQFDPTPNWYAQKIKIKYGRIWKTNMIFLFDPYSIYDLVLFILSYEWEISI